MAVDSLTGSRIRDRRIDRGIRQADLAKKVGISPPYLNLIEHNKRRIAGKLLQDIADALAVPAEQLSQGVSAAALDHLRAAAASLATTAELARAEDLAARFPGWAALIVSQAKQIAALQEHIQVLTDRMTYDSELTGSLHQVISAVTAVRSAASILVGSEEIDADWQARFHRNIYDDSVRLAASSEALIRYLEAPETVRTDQTAPIEEVETALAAVDYHIAGLEGQGRADPEKLARSMASRDAAVHLLQQFLQTYRADAKAMPLARFGPAAKEAGYDPLALSSAFAVPIHAVLRRLSSLPVSDGHPPMGLAVADASGAMLFRKPVGGFALPRSGAGCPLWPLFAAFGRPEQPIRAEVALPDASQQRFLCYAQATPVGTAGFDVPPVLHATMLIIPDAAQGGAPPIPAGVSCRICPRSDCAARREPSAMR